MIPGALNVKETGFRHDNGNILWAQGKIICFVFLAVCERLGVMHGN